MSLKAAIVKKETQIKHKNEMGEELKFIDFHQLQIENKKHVKDIDDRNHKLLVLKTSSANTVASLQELKDKLAEAEKTAASNDKQLQLCKQQKIKQEQDIQKTGQKGQEMKDNIKRQFAILSKFKDEQINSIDFVDLCKKHLDAQQERMKWLRRIEIAELEGKKARAILKKHGIPWNDDMDDMDEN